MLRRLFLIAFAVVSMAAAPARAAVGSPAQWALRSFETWFNKETPYELRMGSVRFDLRDGLILNNVSVREKKSTQPWLTLKELRARPRWGLLLKRQLIIDDATLAGLSVVIDTSRPSTPSRKSGFTGLGILKEIRHFELQDARVLWKGDANLLLNLSPISVSGALRGDQLELASYSIALDSQTLTGKGNVAISTSPVFDLQFVADRLVADKVARRFSTLPNNVNLIYTGDGRVIGNRDRWTVVSKGALAGGSVSFEFTRGKTQQLTSRFNGVALARFIRHSFVEKNTALSGEFRAESALSWRSAARVSGTFNIDGLARNHVRSNVRLSGSVDLNKGRGRTTFVVKGDALTANVTGSFETGSGLVDAKFDVASPRLQALQLLYAPLVNWRGTFGSSGTVAGAWKNPAVDATMHVENFKNDAVSIAALQAGVRSFGAVADHFIVDASAADIRRNAQPGSIWNLDGAQVRWDGNFQRADLHVQALFKNKTQLQGAGDLKHSQNDWQWTWSALSYVFSDSQTWTAEKGGTLDVSNNSGITVSDVRILRENGSLSLHRLRTNGNHLEIVADANDFPIDASVSVSSSAIPVRGTLAANMAFDGSLTDPQGKLSLNFSSGAVNGYGFRRIVVEATASEETLHLQKGEIETSAISEPAHFQGTIPWNWIVPTAPDAAADMTLSFGPVDPAEWIKKIPHATADAGGSVQFDGHVSGRRKNLVVEGSLVASLPHLKFTDYNLDLRDIAVDIQNKNELFQIKKGSARLGKKGTIQLSGQSHWPNVQIAVSGKGIEFKVPRRLDFLGDADVTLTGTLDEPAIAGTVHVRKGTYEVAPKKKKEKDETPAAPSRPSYVDALWQRATMDVAATWNNAVWYRDGLSKIETQSDVRVLKDRGTNQVYLTGSLSLLRGTYDAYGRDFVIKSGELIFTGPPAIDPNLQVDAEYRTVDVTVEVQVSGTASHPQLNFTSTPPMTQQEILSLLATGVSSVTGASLNGSGPSVAPGSDVAASVLSSYLTNQMRASGMNFLALDVLRVTPTATGNVLTVGRYLGPNLFFSYSANSKDTSNRVLNAEYILSPRWSVVGQTGSNTDNYMDLQFRIPWLRKTKEASKPEQKK